MLNIVTCVDQIMNSRYICLPICKCCPWIISQI